MRLQERDDSGWRAEGGKKSTGDGHRREAGGRPSDALTGREAEVLAWISAGLQNKEIAQKLVDAATGLVARAESTRRLRGHDLAIETVFGDYRAAGGAAFPYSIEIGVRGRPRRLRIAVERVEMNPPLDDSRF